MELVKIVDNLLGFFLGKVLCDGLAKDVRNNIFYRMFYNEEYRFVKMRDDLLNMGEEGKNFPHYEMCKKLKINNYHKTCRELGMLFECKIEKTLYCPEKERLHKIRDDILNIKY